MLRLNLFIYTMHLISRLAVMVPLATVAFIPSVDAVTIPQYVYDYGKYSILARPSRCSLKIYIDIIQRPWFGCIARIHTDPVIYNSK